jgi:hypothetical protein
MMPTPRFASRVTRPGLTHWGLSSLLAATFALASWSVARAQDDPATPPADQPTTQPEAAEPGAAMPDAPAPDAAAPAPDAAAPAAPDAAAAQPFDLRSTVENFWHFGKIARYDLAVAAGQQILGAGADPAEVLKAFEEVAASRKDTLEQWLLRWQGVPDMRDVTTQIINLLEQGRRGRAQDANFIEQYIGRLSAGERQYTVNLAHLRDSGEVAVPFMVEWLRNPEKREHHPAIRRALRDMGKFALNPLVAATEMKDWDTLVTIVNVLGDLGYDSAAPYLARLTTDKDAPGTVKAAAAAALQRLGVQGSRGAGAADLFYDQAEKFYYDKASITADNRFNVGYIWYWSDQGLVKKDVPPAIFNELMAMRSTEYALKLGGGQGDALSLWLASNYKREVELPEGATDPTRLPNQPDAHYYGVVTGSQYLNNALARTLKDRNAPVSLKVIKSLQEIIGQSNMFSGQTSRPLIDAMRYPDRLVRFESAFALAGALPQQPFEGQENVVPLLAEALSQTGQPTVYVVAPSQDQVNALVEGFKAQGYNAHGAAGAEAAVANAAQLPAVDVFVVMEDLGPEQVDRLFAMARNNARLQGAARLVITKTGASRYEQMKVSDPLMFTTTATDPATLAGPIEEARNRAGSLPVNPEVATQYATRAAMLLRDVAISRGQVYDLGAAKTALLAALTDARPDIVMLAGNVLGLLNDREAQAGLLQTAQAEQTTDDVKISLYNSLATNAKFFGNQLDQNQVGALAKVVAEMENLDVRSAAAEAHGALNLPPDEAKGLIVEQSQTSLGNVMKAPEEAAPAGEQPAPAPAPAPQQ